MPDRERVIGTHLSACADVLGAEIVHGAWSEEEEEEEEENRVAMIDRKFVTPAWLEPRKAHEKKDFF